MYRIVDRISFIAGIIIIGPVIILGLLLNGGYFDYIHTYSLCAFNNITGLYCPGCGITRSCFALASGHLLLSALYHIVPICAVMVYLIYMIYLFRLKRTLNKRNLSFADTYPKDIEAKSVRFHARLHIVIYIMLGIAGIQWIIKDTLLILGNIDYFTLF